MRTFTLALLLATAGACGGPTSSQPPAQPPQQPQQPNGGDDANRQLTPAECAQAVDHVLAFKAASPEEQQQLDALKPMRDTMIQQCGTQGKKRDFDCLMASKSFQELGKCEEPSGGDATQAPPQQPK